MSLSYNLVYGVLIPSAFGTLIRKLLFCNLSICDAPERFLAFDFCCFVIFAVFDFSVFVFSMLFDF